MDANNFQLPMTTAVLLYQDQDQSFVAHALEFDICSVEDSEDKAVNKLRRSLKHHIEFGLKRGWDDRIKFPAPKDLWEMAAQAKGSQRATAPVLVDVPPDHSTPGKAKQTGISPQDHAPSSHLLMALFSSHAHRQAYSASY